MTFSLTSSTAFYQSFHDRLCLTLSLDGGGPLRPSEPVRASEEGDPAASEPAGGREQGQSPRPLESIGINIRRSIPLTCSSPIDFEFQVYVIEPHEAFSVHPLRGVIPAGGDVQITVTFTPTQYETSQITIQVVVSQFNTKPYLCTVTGSSAPHLALSETEKKMSVDVASGCNKRPLGATQTAPQRKSKHRAAKPQTSAELTGLEPQMDVLSPAGVAKWLIKDPSNPTIPDMKEVHNQQQLSFRHVHLGKEPVSENDRRQLAKEREMAQQKYMETRRDERPGEDFTAGLQKLSSHRVLFEAGQVYEDVPTFQLYPSFQLDLKKRAIKRFQQAARKVVIRCRVSRRMTLWKQAVCAGKPASSQKGLDYPLISTVRTEEGVKCMLKISPHKIFPFTFPNFPDEDDPLVSLL
ncbi:unnamed protein product [Tetraodon nigroviridis]|uniref:(spotted green pufferfish) hypothetical protein n=1 Tax=Tetraodon nigroviridis TaxID=99883 RepID=Q4SYW5_TETNG|nr:unnamed protein product [Tetraodon nigroviridis]